jgi:hypothetical protein
MKKFFSAERSVVRAHHPHLQLLARTVVAFEMAGTAPV